METVAIRTPGRPTEARLPGEFSWHRSLAGRARDSHRAPLRAQLAVKFSRDIREPGEIFAVGSIRNSDLKEGRGLSNNLASHFHFPVESRKLGKQEVISEGSHG